MARKNKFHKHEPGDILYDSYYDRASDRFIMIIDVDEKGKEFDEPYYTYIQFEDGCIEQYTVAYIDKYYKVPS